MGSEVKMAAALLQMSCWYRGMLLVRRAGISSPLIPGLLPTHFRTFCVQQPREEPLEDNPYYSKYQDKIRKLHSAKPQEFKARLEKRHEVKNEPIGHSKQSEFVRMMEQELDKKGQRSTGGHSGGFTKDKMLGSILNLELIHDKTGDEISELWMKYYSTKDTISAVIPTQTFEVMFNRARSSPVFLYALPQQEGYEFFLGQWAGHELHFTSLINVQTLGEHAPSQLILYHYPELSKDKGIILMTAEMDRKFISVHQAQCLANQVQLFYGTPRQETFRLVEAFNHSPADFKHVSVIAELEQSGLGAAAPSTA